jgi:hypothetical protein
MENILYNVCFETYLMSSSIIPIFGIAIGRNLHLRILKIYKLFLAFSKALAAPQLLRQHQPM